MAPRAMRVTYVGGWDGYVDVDEHMLVWTTTSRNYRGEVPIRESIYLEGMTEFLVEDIGLGDDFWEWLPDN